MTSAIPVRRPQSSTHASSAAASRPQASAAPDRVFVRPRQACDMLGIGMTKLYALLKDGLLERRKIGGATVIPVASIDAFAAALEREVA